MSCDVDTTITKEESKPKAKKKIVSKCSLKEIEYRGDKIKINDFNVFDTKNRSKNDSHNKLRENIVASIINDEIPSEFYKKSTLWRNLKKELYNYIEKNLFNTKDIKTIKCIIKAGRKHNNDFEIRINNTYVFQVEFKFNATKSSETPQFVSPMKPSQYLQKNFEEYFYENYLPKIVNLANLNIPNKEEYFKTIHRDKVECMKLFKEKYDTDKYFNKECKKIDKEAIKQFIESSDLDIKKLSNYLLNSQKNKVYMCYKDGKFYYDKINENLYKIKKVEARKSTNYICVTESGMKLEVRLRFKNGCGLQFPAFQIKRKLPTVKELKNICYDDGIPKKDVPRKKADILKMLDEKGIIY